ncbi:MAG TPA: lipopolysaccharide biosynthesis protein [Acidimicrobiales bacterium]|nr:lipopolysaccharide biosynthesis protein [Acidimicrobiales bacterium]
MNPISEIDDASATEAGTEEGGRSGLRGGVASGVRWGTLDRTVQTVLRLGTTVLLARLVAPEDFGLLAIALVVVNLAALISGLGLGPALVQRKDLRPEHVGVAFTLSAGFGVVLATMTALSAFPAAAFFDQPALRSVLPVLAVIFLFKGVELTPNDMLVRKMRFRGYYITSTIAVTVASAVGVILALAGWGIWALVSLSLVEAALASILAWVVSIRAGVWSPSVSMDRAALRDLLPYSSYVTVSLLVGYGQTNADNLLIGKMLGPRALGYYSLAYRAFLLPLQRFGEVVSDSVFPALSAVKDDLPRLRAGFLRSNQYVALVFFPLTVGMAVTAPQAIPVAFGPQWIPAVHPLQVLALTGPLISMSRLKGPLLIAIGRPNWDFWLNTFSVALFVPAFLVGVQHGILGVAISYALASAIEAPVVVFVLSRAIRTRPGAVVRPLIPIALATAVMAAGAAGTGALLEGSVTQPLQLVAMVITGAALYVLSLRVLARELLAGMVRDLLRRGQ